MSTNKTRGFQQVHTLEEKGDGCCHINLKIDSQGPVNIYNCSGHPPGRAPCPPAECPEGPIASGQCVPLSIGSKPKQSQRTKLDAILANTRVPSSIAAAFFHHARRFQAGQSPANAFEQSA